MRRFYFILFLMTTLLHLFLLTQSHSEQQKRKVFETVLDNGLTVVIEEIHSAPVADARVFVKTGALYEGEYIGAGISHYLEHIVSGGTTTKRTEAESERLSSLIGGNKNAYTSYDVTCYHITTSSLYIDTAIELLADYVQNCVFDSSEVVREKGVILKEIAKNQDQPTSRLYRLYNRTDFTIHPERHPIIGYANIFEKITRDDLIKYYKERYIPSNMIFVVAGDVDTDKILEKIKMEFKDSKYKPVPPSAFYLPDEPEQTFVRRAEDEMDIKTTYCLIGFNGVPIVHKDAPAIEVLSVIAGQGESSRLYREIKDKQQLVDQITAGFDSPYFKGAGAFYVDIRLNYKNIDKAEKSILEELSKLKQQLVSDAELEKAKKMILANYYFSNQDIEDRANILGRDKAGTGNALFREEYLANIQKVTKEDIQRVAQKYIDFNTYTIVVLKPTGTVAVKDTTKVIQEKITSESKIERIVLDNGIILILKNNPGLPTVAVRLYVKGGVRLENDDNNGIFNLTAVMTLKGTKKRTSEQIAKEIDALGGTIDAWGGKDAVGYDLQILSSDIDKGLEIFSDVIMNPTFPQSELEKVKKSVISQLAQQEDDWRKEAEIFFNKTHYKVHPYRLNPLGTNVSISKLKVDDLKSLHQKYWIANNMIIAIVGDIDIESTKLIVKKYFSTLKKGNAVFPDIPVEQPLTENHIEIKYNEKKQAVIRQGYRGMNAGDPDWYAMYVLDGIISGISLPGGWLHTSLRGNQLVYYVHFWNDAYLDPGAPVVVAATTPDKLESALKIIDEKMEKIKNDFVTDEELDSAKRLCIIMEGLSNQTNWAQAQYFALYEVYGLGYDYRFKDFAEKINAVTKDDIKRVANKYFNYYTRIITRPK